MCYLCEYNNIKVLVTVTNRVHVTGVNVDLNEYAQLKDLTDFLMKFDKVTEII